MAVDGRRAAGLGAVRREGNGDDGTGLRLGGVAVVAADAGGRDDRRDGIFCDCYGSRRRVTGCVGQDKAIGQRAIGERAHIVAGQVLACTRYGAARGHGTAAAAGNGQGIGAANLGAGEGQTSGRLVAGVDRRLVNSDAGEGRRHGIERDRTGIVRTRYGASAADIAGRDGERHRAVPFGAGQGGGGGVVAAAETGHSRGVTVDGGNRRRCFGLISLESDRDDGAGNGIRRRGGIVAGDRH